MDQAAQALHPLLDELVFVGGATVGLLLTDQAADAPRPTLDVDVATRVPTRAAFNQLEQRLYELGFAPDQDGPICRYTKGALIIDVMSDDADIQGFSNPWYASAIDTAQMHRLPSRLRVRVMDAPHLVATKFVAWTTRGQRDMFHHDLEDILTVVDGRQELKDELDGAPTALQLFVQTEFTTLLQHPDFEETLLGFCRTDERTAIVLDRIRQLTGNSPGPRPRDTRPS